MNAFPPKKVETKNVDLATFYLGRAAYGIDILKIQEINKLLDLTPVPGSAPHIRGILNLRGQIVTVIDLSLKLGLRDSHADARGRNIIVRSRGEHIGLLVERIGEVVSIHGEEIEPPPANLNGLQGELFQGVVKTKDLLIGILDMEKALD